MRKLSEIGKSLTKRRNESGDQGSSPDNSEFPGRLSSSDDQRSKELLEIAKLASPPTPERKGMEISPLSRRTSLSDPVPSSPSGHDGEDDSKGKFRTSVKRLSFKNLRSSSYKDSKLNDKRVSNWVLSFPQFSMFAPKFVTTTWDQLLGYTAEDLHKLGLPLNAATSLSKIIAVLAEESVMEKHSVDGSVFLTPTTSRPRNFSYTNRAIATSEHVKTLEELFQELDTESKGFINESELSVALQRYGVVDQEGAKAWFADIDNSQRGVIDQQQFVDFMTYVYPLIFQPSPMWSPRTGSHEPPTVFLGGSCNPTSWRKDIVIPLLQKASISFFNPQVSEWHEALIAIEARAKASATLLFFVIDSLTLALSSMIECTELILSGRPIILVINDLPPDAKMASGEPMPAQLIKDANRARAYMADVAVRHRIQPYCSISRAACELIQFLHGGWTGGFETSRPRSTLAKKSEESWTSLKQKFQAAISKVNAGRRNSFRGSVSLPEPSALTLPPPRSPEKHPSLPRSTPIELPELPPFSSSPGAMNSLSSFHSYHSSHPSPHPSPAFSSFPPPSSASPPVSPSKMTPVSLVGSFSHLNVSPPMRSRTSPHTRAFRSLVIVPTSSSSSSSSSSSASSSPLEARAVDSDRPRGHVRATSSFSSASSLADIAEVVKQEELAESLPPLPTYDDKPGPDKDSPRFSIISTSDLVEFSPPTPPSTSPTSLSPRQSKVEISTN